LVFAREKARYDGAVTTGGGPVPKKRQKPAGSTISAAPAPSVWDGLDNAEREILRLEAALVELVAAVDGLSNAARDEFPGQMPARMVATHAASILEHVFPTWYAWRAKAREVATAAVVGA